MQQPFERLREARQARFPSASEAARALDVPIQTYIAHENGGRPLLRAAPRYAKFFRVSLDWLVEGRGSRKGDGPAGSIIQIVGRVGAGAEVHPIDTDTAGLGIDEIQLPDAEYLGALEVDGDSQYPRYLRGEIVLFDTRPVGAGQLVDRYAVVDLVDGRRLLKLIRRIPLAGKFWLESHNAPPMRDVDIEAVYAISGTLTR